MPYDVITIGSAIRDIFLVSKEFKLVSSNKAEGGVLECVTLGVKIEVDEIFKTTGGGSTNAAATFGNLGFKVAAVGRIGDDYSGRAVLDDLKANKVSTSLMKTIKGGQTAHSTLLTEPKSGERTVLVHRGVSATFSPSDIPWKRINADWIYMTSLGGNLKLAHRVVKHAAKTGTKVFWNPGGKEAAAGMRALLPLLAHTTILSLNREEARVLFKKDYVPELGGGKIIKSLPPTLTLIITDGPRGAYAYLDGSAWFVTPQNVKVISRTGAGDAFGSGLTAALMRGMGIDDALRVGLVNSQSVIQSFGAKRGIIKRFPGKKVLASIKVKAL